MLVHIVVTILLLGFSLILGSALMQSIGSAAGMARSNDQRLVGAFIGLLLLGWLLLIIALVVPLDLRTFAVVIAILSGLSLSRTEVRRDVRSLTRRPRYWMIALSATALSGFITLRPVSVYDTGLYHYQYIRWLTEHGNPPGLALLHMRFGFISSWFALHAPLDAGPLVARSTTLIAGSTIALVIVIMMMTTTRVLRNDAAFSDLVILIGTGLWLPLVFVPGFASSPSPDLPVSFLPLLIAWSFMIRSSSARSNDGRVSAPWLLAALSMALKLSALPLLAAAAIWQLYLDRSPRRLPAMALAAFVIGIPLMAVYIAITGCPAFPATTLCLQSPTSLPVETARATAVTVTEWARWSGSTPAGANQLNWVPGWFGRERIAAGLIVLWLFGMGVSIFAVLKNWLEEDERKNIIAAALTSVLGLAFTFATAPTFRFMLGYLVLGIAIGVAVIAQRFSTATRRFGVAVGIASILVLAAIVRQTPIPPVIPDALESTAPIIEIHAETWVYRIPIGDDRCWDAELPCTTREIADPSVQPRSDDLSDGFFRRENPGS